MSQNNVCFITMDDMRYDEMAFMPNVCALLRGEGVSFTGCRVEVPVCTPARTGLLTGQYSTHHGVTDNGDPTNWTNNVFVALDNAGYRVGGIGKMVSSLYATVKRPGFDEWRALMAPSPDPGYGIYDSTNYRVHDGTTATAYTTYQDHQLARFALDFVTADYTASPWALWFCPTAPHWPFQAPPNYSPGYRDYRLSIEADVSDKPSWIQALPVITDEIIAEMQTEQRLRLLELKAADDAIGALVNTIRGTGQGDRTTIIFTSDNGNHLGEHRIVGGLTTRAGIKNTLYDPAMKVPMVVAGPGLSRGRVTVPTNHQDATATILDLADTSAILPNQVGVSLMTVAANPAAYASRQLLHRRNTDGTAGMPGADGITTATRKLVRYDATTGTDQYEMYDLDTDPNELVNVANVSGRLTERNALVAALDALKAA